MAAHRRDLTGQRFGRLVAVRDVGADERGGRLWEFRCDCGNTVIRRGTIVTGGDQKSCGCLANEIRVQHQLDCITHGASKTRLYRIWRCMKKRCYVPKTHEFENYGGRGITVCEEWRNSFEAFRDWAIPHGYSDTLTIDRINVNGNYEPDNCRWATYYEQIHNRRCSPQYRLKEAGVQV